MNHTDLPPLPVEGASGPDICAIMRLYLAVAQDISPEQLQLVLKHIQFCQVCSREHVHVQRATQLVASLEASSPSARVDQAVLAAIAARNHERGKKERPSQPSRPLVFPSRNSRKPSRRLVGMVAAVLLLAVLSSAYFISGLPAFFSRYIQPTPQTAFALPANLSWGFYVLYHSETKVSASGERYQVNVYHYLAADNMNVETVMDGKVDVMMVTDGNRALGLDMMHHIAQWGADQWGVDDSMFDLPQLRKDLQAGHAVYLGIDDFKGQKVYRIRWNDGLVLLLDMQYRPVNVLRGATGPGTGTPVYDTFQLLQPSKVPDSMWDMSVPSGFKMGTLPTLP